MSAISTKRDWISIYTKYPNPWHWWGFWPHNTCHCWHRSCTIRPDHATYQWSFVSETSQGIFICSIIFTWDREWYHSTSLWRYQPTRNRGDTKFSSPNSWTTKKIEEYQKHQDGSICKITLHSKRNRYHSQMHKWRFRTVEVLDSEQRPAVSKFTFTMTLVYEKINSYHFTVFTGSHYSCIMVLSA